MRLSPFEMQFTLSFHVRTFPCLFRQADISRGIICCFDFMIYGARLNTLIPFAVDYMGA